LDTVATDTPQALEISFNETILLDIATFVFVLNRFRDLNIQHIDIKINRFLISFVHVLYFCGISTISLSVFHI
jgi:hypothetical protein